MASRTASTRASRRSSRAREGAARTLSRAARSGRRARRGRTRRRRQACWRSVSPLVEGRRAAGADSAVRKTAKSFRLYQIISQGLGRPGASRTASVGCCDPFETYRTVVQLVAASLFRGVHWWRGWRLVVSSRATNTEPGITTNYQPLITNKGYSVHDHARPDASAQELAQVEPWARRADVHRALHSATSCRPTRPARAPRRARSWPKSRAASSPPASSSSATCRRCRRIGQQFGGSINDSCCGSSASTSRSSADDRRAGRR